MRYIERGKPHHNPERHAYFMKPHSATLPKSSKGIFLQGSAEKTFVKEIESAYAAGDCSANSSNGVLNAKDIKEFVRKIVHEAIGDEHPLPDDADFYHSGRDSAKCTKIWNLLQTVYCPP
jgi:hypothetical protein